MKILKLRTFRFAMLLFGFFLTASVANIAMACGCKPIKVANYQVYRVPMGCCGGDYYPYY